MKNYDRIIIGIVIGIILIGSGVNLSLSIRNASENGRPWLVEVNRIALALEEDPLEEIDLSEYHYVTELERYKGNSDFYDTTSNYCIREINGELYRFEYSLQVLPDMGSVRLAVNLGLGVMALFLLLILLMIRQQILVPFETLVHVPYELAKGNLTIPLKESKSRFFGRFVWGVDLLRETMEEQKQRELRLQRDKKTLLLSLSHDIKTPLSAIKLYAKALEKGLYTEEETRHEIAEAIDKKADEIEGFVSEIVQASREEFLSLEVNMGEYYLSEIMKKIQDYYGEKLSFIQTEFLVGTYVDCLLKADKDRSVEVLQNVMENAVKYGDGTRIEITVSEEENCILLAIKNSGNSLLESEIPHIFESFWRGANVKNQPGSGLGLYISRQLMHKMGGEIFAEIKDQEITVTTVFMKV